MLPLTFFGLVLHGLPAVVAKSFQYMSNLGDKCVIRITCQQVLSFELCYSMRTRWSNSRSLKLLEISRILQLVPHPNPNGDFKTDQDAFNPEGTYIFLHHIIIIETFSWSSFGNCMPS